MKFKHFNLTQLDKKGEMGNNSSLQEERFAEKSVLWHLIFLTEPQVAIPTFSVQTNFVVSQVAISAFRGIKPFSLSLLQLALKEARQEKEYVESFQHTYSVTKLQIPNNLGQTVITQGINPYPKERERTSFLAGETGMLLKTVLLL